MTLEHVDWAQLETLPEPELLSEVFDLLCEASYRFQAHGDTDIEPATLVPRLLELRERRKELLKLAGPAAALARTVGLWNYLDDLAPASRERLISEAARIEQLQNLVLHREQWRALDALLSGKNVILSAPTSFGKSLLIDALIVMGGYSRIAVIVPTIALLDETRRRLTRAAAASHDIVSHHSETPTRDKVVFLGTQERLLSRDDIGHLDLLVVDEFYKLDPARKDDRSASLNAAVYKFLNRATQFFFLGPNIDSITMTEATSWNFEFIRTRLSTVAVDTLDLTKIADRQGRLIHEAQNEGNWPALVFASSPDRANALVHALADTGTKFGDGAPGLAAWMRDSYWSGWPLCDAIERGVAAHHGRIPRALASRLVRDFDLGKIAVLICTSTLIEGVNTAARSVMIYDRKINKSNYDFFTFSNIRGRAGRLGKHYVGRVFLFNAPPNEEEIGVDTPLFSDLRDAPDDLMVHFEPQHLGDTGNAKIDRIASEIGIDVNDIRRFSSISVDVMRSFKSAIDDARAHGRLPIWHNYPEYGDILAVNKIICKVKNAMGEFGAASDNQLTYYMNRLRAPGSSLHEFFRWYGNSQLKNPDNFDKVFKFLRACEYGLGEYFTLIEVLVNSVSHEKVDYSYFVAAMRNWFRPECTKVLDERGIPVQLSERFYRSNDTIESLVARLLDAATTGNMGMTDFERGWIVDVLSPGTDWRGTQ